MIESDSDEPLDPQAMSDSDSILEAGHKTPKRQKRTSRHTDVGPPHMIAITSHPDRFQLSRSQRRMEEALNTNNAQWPIESTGFVLHWLVVVNRQLRDSGFVVPASGDLMEFVSGQSVHRHSRVRAKLVYFTDAACPGTPLLPLASNMGPLTLNALQAQSRNSLLLANFLDLNGVPLLGHVLLPPAMAQLNVYEVFHIACWLNLGVAASSRSVSSRIQTICGMHQLVRQCKTLRPKRRAARRTGHLTFFCLNGKLVEQARCHH